MEKLIFTYLPGPGGERPAVDEKAHVSEVILALISTGELEYFADLSLQSS